MEQGEKYFVAKISSDLLDSESGRVKKVKEEKKLKSTGNIDASIDLMKKLSDYLGK